MSGTLERAEAAVRAAVERAQARCPADAEEWHAWARGRLAGYGPPAHGAASSAATALRSARRLGAQAAVDGCHDAIASAEAAISLDAATRFVREAERSASQVEPVG